MSPGSRVIFSDRVPAPRPDQYPSSLSGRRRTPSFSFPPPTKTYYYEDSADCCVHTCRHTNTYDGQIQIRSLLFNMFLLLFLFVRAALGRLDP